MLKRFAQLMRRAGGGGEAEGLTCADTSGGRRDGQRSSVSGSVECSARRPDDTNAAGGSKAGTVHALAALQCTCVLQRARRQARNASRLVVARKEGGVLRRRISGIAWSGKSAPSSGLPFLRFSNEHSMRGT